MSNQKKFIVLDFDGTLIDTERVMLECCYEYASMQNLNCDSSIINNFVGASPNDILDTLHQAFGGDFDAVSFVKSALDYYNNKLKTNLVPLLPNAKDLLNYLRENGYTIGMATTTYRDIVMHEVEGHNIKQYFDYFVTGDMVKKAKPSPEIYQKITAIMGVKPEDCFAVEDSTVGITSAISAGMKTIAVPDLHQVTDENKDKCVAIVKGCQGVIDYLKTLNL